MLWKNGCWEFFSQLLTDAKATLSLLVTPIEKYFPGVLGLLCCARWF